MNEIRAGLIKGHEPVEKWTPENVTDFIMACRSQGGIPMFVTHFAGARFKFDGSNAVLGKCFAGIGPEISKYFYDVPEKEVEEIEESTGDWRKLLMKYAPQALPKAERYGIYLKGFKLPRIGGKK